jgi:uncharacterized protein (DUF1697 family)
MSRVIAFLRAINIDGGRTVKMSVLRRLFETLGFSNVATFIGSGNVLFETRAKNSRILEKKIGKRLRDVLGYEVAVFIRADVELAKIANYKPFSQSKIDDAAEFNIVFLGDTLDEKRKQMMAALKTNTDEFRVHGREIYWLRHKKPHGSTFSTVPLEKTLGRAFTVRCANTVRRLAAKYSSPKR